MADVHFKPTFRNKKAEELFAKMCNDSYIYEAGIDNQGRIYFAYLNGNVERYTRRQFLQLANNPE